MSVRVCVCACLCVCVCVRVRVYVSVCFDMLPQAKVLLIDMSILFCSAVVRS